MEDIKMKRTLKYLCENEELALANLLYILDIRGGKGERRIFKTIFEYKKIFIVQRRCLRLS